MSNFTGGANTVCPFYEMENQNSISCEGVFIPSVITMKFKSGKDKKQWQEKYCFLFEYNKCPIARGLIEKYEAIEKKEKSDKIKLMKG